MKGLEELHVEEKRKSCVGEEDIIKERVVRAAMLLRNDMVKSGSEIDEWIREVCMAFWESGRVTGQRLALHCIEIKEMDVLKRSVMLPWLGIW